MTGCRDLTEAEVRRVLREIKNPLWRALFVLGVNTGFRVSELLSIEWGQVVSADGRWSKEIVIGEKHMKEGRSRCVPLNTASQAALQEWLQEFGRRNVATATAPVFSRDGLVEVSRFAALRAIRLAFSRAGLAAGRRRLGTHCMRKTFAVLWFRHFCQESGGDLGTALLRTSKLIGHSKIDVTTRYLESTSVFSDQLMLASEHLGERLFGPQNQHKTGDRS